MAEVNAAEASGYIGILAARRGLDQAIGQESFLSLMEVVQMVDTTLIETAKNEAPLSVSAIQPIGRLWHSLYSWNARSGRKIRTSLARA